MHRCWSLAQLLLLSLMSASSGYQSSTGSSGYTGRNFSHLELYSVSGQELVLVAQKNGLLRLSPDLSRSSLTLLGPLNDSQTCMPHQIHQGMASCNLALTDNYIRAVSIVNNSQLHFCMSYLSGSCAGLNLTGLDTPLRVNTSAVAAVLSDSVGGLLCRNPESRIFITVSDRSLGGGSSVPDALYLTMPFCASRPDKIEPTLAIVDSRTLQKYAVSEDFNIFPAEIVSRRDFIRPGGLTHHGSFRRVSHGAAGPRSCVYFVLTARDGAPRTPRIRLARLCSDDLNLSNYVEAFVDCGGCGTLTAGEVDCVGGAAAVAKSVGNHLAQLLNISAGNEFDSEVLFLTSRVRHQNGVCAVPMAAADRLLDAILDDCRAGRPLSRFGPAYLREELACSQQAGAASSSGTSGGAARGGSWAGVVSADPSRVFRAPFLVAAGSDEMTAVDAVATSRGDTLVYVGTSLGRLLGYRIKSTPLNESAGRFFEASLPDRVLTVRTGRDRLFALTDGMVYSQPYANCEYQFNTCSDCLAASNPHCLWSNLPGTNGGCRTVRPQEPLNATELASLSYLTSAEHCSRVTPVSGEDIDIDRLRQVGNVTYNVVATVSNAPQGLKLYCHIEDETAVANAVHSGTMAVVTCGLRTDRLIEYLGNLTSRQLTVRLSVNKQPDRSSLASTRLVVFACSRHASCGSCADHGSGQCGWCVAGGACLAAGSSDCRLNDSLAKELLISSRSECPQVRLASEPATVPVLPSGATEEQLDGSGLLYTASGLQPYMRQFHCTVACPGTSPVDLPASLLDSGRQLNCRIPSQARLTYASRSLLNVTCSMRFYWSSKSTGGSRSQLDAVSPAGSLVLYKCQNMAGSCDACALAVPQRFGCVWCGDVCSFEATCNASSVQHGGLCANPQLLSVRPAKLVPRKNLRLRADGANLGNSPDSLSARLVASAAESAALECRIVSSSYQPGRSFVCLVDEAPLADIGDYRLEVTVLGLANGATATAVSCALPVRLPAITSVMPAAVQRSGRVAVHLQGAHLDAGSDLFVAWRLEGGNSSGLSLEITSEEVLERTNESLIMKLGSFDTTGTYSPVLTVQGHVVQNKSTGKNVLLQVLPDAALTIAKEELRSCFFPAGGLDFVISGERLSTVRRAVLRLVEVLNSSDATPDRTEQPLTLEARCHLTTSKGIIGERLVCPSPTVPPLMASNRMQRQRRSFLERVQPVRRFSATILLDALSHPYPIPILTLFPNPTLEPLPARPKVLLASASDAGQSRQLQLIGRDLLQSVKPTDIRVTIGSAPCNHVTPIRVAARRQEVTTCQFRLSERDLGRALQVRASIGRLSFDLGHVTFAVEFPWIYVYIVSGIGSMLLIAAAIACCIHVHQQSRKRRDKVNGIEVHLNNLEAKVSKSCREAFAELQLNSNPDGPFWTEDSIAPVPVRTYGQFAAYSCFAERYKDRFRANDYLFADVATEDAASGHDSPDVRKALGQLRHLLLNEDFLLTLISALESRTDSFMHQERNHFGSLVSALLFSDPTYFTRILSVLIRQLIERKRDAQDNCKVTFRRCDSVAERLLPNWLAFLMYDHLASRVAEPLYRLNREMRLQIYRGPVDQVTEDSRYTINEQKLLKKEITFRAITLIFHDRLRQFDDGTEPLQCKVPVLNCDTVRQAKEKILDAVYSRLRVPASRRLQADHFDLVRVATPAAAGAESKATGRPQADGFQVLLDVDELDTGCDGMQRLRRMSCLNLGDTAANSNGASAGPFWVYLRPRKHAGSSIESTRRGLYKGASYADIGSLPSGVSSKSLQDMKHISNSYTKISTAAPRQYHLIQPSGAASHTLDRGNKKRRHGGRIKRADANDGDNQQIVSEVLYPILLSTKKNLVDKITSLFAALFPTDQELLQQQQQLKRLSTAVPMDQEQAAHQEEVHQQQADIPQCLVNLFHLLDQLAVKERGERAADVAHVWKSNALMLRFYTHHLLNVEYLLDVDVPGPVRYCMSTVSTLFMDACSAEQPKKPDKTSTAQRLLFYSEIASLHQRVNAYYASVRRRYLPAESADDSMLTATSLSQPQSQPLLPPPRDCRPFNAGPLLKELFVNFVFKYLGDVIRHLQQQQPRVSDSLIASLQSIALVLSSESPMQQQQQQQQQQHTLNLSGSRERKKRSNSRPALDSNAYEL